MPVRRIHPAELMTALQKGAEDFWAQPSQLVFLMLIYPLVGLIAARLSFGYDVLPLLFPLVAGFALVGPVAAVGLYEISRRRERGMAHGWRYAFTIYRSPSFSSIVMLGLVLMVIFLVWLVVAWGIYRWAFGDYEPQSISDFLRDVFETREGWKLILVGNGVGFLFALLVLVISVVSFPLLVDRRVGLATAVRTSLAVVAANPIPIALWGLIVAGLLFLGMIPLFVGLAVVLPILGHATWHLYRLVVI